MEKHCSVGKFHVSIEYRSCIFRKICRRKAGVPIDSHLVAPTEDRRLGLHAPEDAHLFFLACKEELCRKIEV